MSSSTIDDQGDARKTLLEESPRSPLESRGTLGSFSSYDVTPVIGTEFEDVDLAAWLEDPNSDAMLRDLAILISQRGVVFFRKQDGLSNELQKQLTQRLGELVGKPATSKLHIHPVIKSGPNDPAKDPEITIIDSSTAKVVFGSRDGEYKKQSRQDEWHSDVTFEAAPPDYTILRMTELPRTGGDTLWASGYEVYDRISRPYQKFLESLTATYSQPKFRAAAAEGKVQLYTSPRGSPDNVGGHLSAVHPVVRTNPVTGWKSVFSVGHHVERINDLTAEESDHLLNALLRLVTDNHDLQVRHRWQSVNDLAIWDNRSTYHAATPDTEAFGRRVGQRTVGVGEKPYIDSSSTSRRESLALNKTQ